MNVIESFNDSKSKEIFKNLLCFFLITVDIKVVNIITIVNIIIIVNMIKVVLYDEILVIISDSLLLFILI